MDNRNATFLGVDLGGAKLMVGEMDIDGSLLRHKRYASGYLSQREALELVQRSIDDFLASRPDCPPLSAIGLGLIGRVDSQSGAWMQIDHDRAEPLDVAATLEDRYGVPCFIDNDVRSAAKAEIPDERFIMPETISEDYEVECRKFQKALEDRGGIDLQMLGLGYNGHIGINQPGTPFASETWVSPMDPVFEERVRRETGVGPEHELGGLTLGIRTIMHARRIVLVAKGAHKADMVRQMLKGPAMEDIPASVLRLHPNCTFLLDADAAAYVKDMA